MEMQIVDFGDATASEISNGKGRARFTVEGDGDYNYEVQIATAVDYKAKKTRVYVDGEDDVDFSAASAASQAAGSWSRGVDSDADKMWDAANREVVRNKKNVMTEAQRYSRVIRQMFNGGVKFNFSKKAGCSMCPCSPGFIASEIAEVGAVVKSYDGSTVFRTFRVEDVWVTRVAKVAAESVAA